MNIWRILEIEETIDKNEIQAAYRAKLLKTHPEDDPEGFMELRAAYEEAIKLADRAERAGEAGSAAGGSCCEDGADGNGTGSVAAGMQWGSDPVGLWMQKVDHVYNHFSKRKNPEEWKKLLEDEAAINLDTKVQARSELLKYFMEHYFLPQEVMTVLDQHFGFIENMDELSEEFPRNYLDIIIVQGLQREEYPPYRYLNGDDSCDFDEYLRTGIRLSQYISAGDTKKGLQAVEDMKSMGIDNPFLDIDYAKVLCQAERYDEAAFWLEDLLEEYPEIDDVHLMMADVCFFMEDYDGAMEKYQMIFDKDPEQEWAAQGRAKCMMKNGQFKEANEIFCKLMEKNPYDMDTGEWLRECNNQHIKALRKQLGLDGDEEPGPDTGDSDPQSTCGAPPASAGSAAVPDADNTAAPGAPEDEQGTAERRDQSLLMDLGWCYFQNEEYDQVLSMMQYVVPEDEHKIGYESLVGRSALFADRYMKAIKHLQNWEQLLLDLDDSEENTEKKKNQMPFCLLLQSYAWDKKGDNHKSLEVAEKALTHDPEDTEILVHKGMMLSKMWYMDDAVECFNRAIELRPELHTAYVMRARALYYMGYYSDGYEDCERTLERFPYELAAFVFKVKILLEVGQFDMADEILAYLEGEELAGTELDFLKGFVLEARGQQDEAWAIYEGIVNQPADREKQMFDVQNLAEVYHHMAVLKYGSKGATYGQVEDLIDKGLAEDARYVYLLEMRAEMAGERKQFKKALETYLKIEEVAPGRIGIYGAIDNLLREQGQWDRALEYAEKQLVQLPTGYNFMRRGQLYAYMNRNEDAEADFKKAMHLAPDLSYPYNYMGVLVESYGDEAQALELYKKAIEVGERENDVCMEAYHNAANLLCRDSQFVSARMTLKRGFELTGDITLLYEEFMVARREGEFDDAEELLKEYHQKAGDKSDAVKYMVDVANILREKGEIDKAFSLYKPLVERSSEAGLEVGKILFYKGMYREAVDYITDAIEVYRAEFRREKKPSGINGPEMTDEDNLFLLSEYYLWAGKAALEGGFIEEAHQFAHDGLFLIPDNYEKYESCVPMVQQMIGGHHTILGNYEIAEEYLQKALEAKKCDYCVHGYCIDACFEMIYLCLLTGRREEALEYLAKGSAADPIDTDFRNMRDRLL